LAGLVRPVMPRLRKSIPAEATSRRLPLGSRAPRDRSGLQT
jgi:hypothetical protein